MESYEEFLSNVVNLSKENKWGEVIQLNKNSDKQIAEKLLWVWPSEENLKFIKNILKKHKLSGIISIGCGCGLLEWIFQQALNTSVIGYEVNDQWWNSRYCNPQFIELQFPEQPPTEAILFHDYALLFCYFNNGPAFIEYVSCYTGNVIIIIGPGKLKGRCTNPEPFDPNFGHNKNWTLDSFEEVKNTKDFIAVYVRQNNELSL